MNEKIKVLMLGIAASLIIIFSISGCSVESVDADEEGVFVKKPIFLGAGGVDPQPLLQGTGWRVFTTDFVKFKNTPIQFTETFEDIVTKDNNLVDVNTYLTLQLIKGQSGVLLDEFGLHWYETNIKELYRKAIRDKLNVYDMPSLLSNRTIYEKSEQEVEDLVRRIIKEKKMPLEVKSVIVGRAVPNKEVKEEIDRTAAQIQAKNTEIKRGEKEDSRKDAERKRAIADKAYMNELGLTMEEFIKLRSLEIEKEKVEMVKNKPNVQIDLLMSGADHSVPMYDLRK